MAADGDRVWVRVTMRGTQHGPFMEAPASGKAIATTTVNELRLEDGNVAEEWGSPTP